MFYNVKLNVGIADVRVKAENAGIAMGKAIEAVEDMVAATDNITLVPQDIYATYAVEEEE